MHQVRKNQLESTIQQIRTQIEDLQEQLLSFERYTGDEYTNNRRQMERETWEKELNHLRELLESKEAELDGLDKDASNTLGRQGM
jgi:chromosome segregation ATPase